MGYSNPPDLNLNISTPSHRIFQEARLFFATIFMRLVARARAASRAEITVYAHQLGSSWVKRLIPETCQGRQHSSLQRVQNTKKAMNGRRTKSLSDCGNGGLLELDALFLLTQSSTSPAVLPGPRPMGCFETTSRNHNVRASRQPPPAPSASDTGCWITRRCDFS